MNIHDVYNTVDIKRQKSIYTHVQDI